MAPTRWYPASRANVPSSRSGVCDNDCRDLDLILLDERGNEISQDTSTDDIPIVNARPKWTGRFTLRVIMEDCRVNPCNYGVRFFSDK